MVVRYIAIFILILFLSSCGLPKQCADDYKRKISETEQCLCGAYWTDELPEHSPLSCLR